MAKSSHSLRGWLIGMTVLAIVVACLAFMPMLMSFMVFDAGETIEAWTTFIAIWMTPVVMFGAIVCAWIAYAADSHRITLVALIVATIPLAFLGILAGLAVVGMLAS